MNRLYFGGSFNPIHHGHLLVARTVAEARGFDRVVLIPSAQPPHKPGHADIAPAADRLTMCRLAVLGSDLFETNDLELRRRGPSYTIDTARALTAQGLGPVNWLIGGDTLPLLSNWYEPEALLKEVRFLTVARPGSSLDWSTLPYAYQKLKADVVTAPLIEISATKVRHRIARGQSVDYLTPPPVIQYIREQNLYR